MNGGGGGGVPQKGLSPMQSELFRQGKVLVKDYFENTAPLAQEQANLATGGLLLKGMSAVDQALETPNPAPGIQARSAARYGISLTPDQQAANDNASALTKASTGVMAKSNARSSLVNAQRGMTFGGVAA
jgi:hypothetical protein